MPGSGDTGKNPKIDGHGSSTAIATADDVIDQDVVDALLSVELAKLQYSGA